MEYKNASDRSYQKSDETKVKCGTRLDGDSTISFGEAVFDAGVVATNQSVALKTGVQVHALQAGGKLAGMDADFRYFGGDLGLSLGLDKESLKEKDTILGGEIKARATLTEMNLGPINAHVGYGVSSAFKVQNKTAEAKVAGCGVKVGKKIGVSVFDNEISIETLTLVGKGWLW